MVIACRVGRGRVCATGVAGDVIAGGTAAGVRESCRLLSKGRLGRNFLRNESGLLTLSAAAMKRFLPVLLLGLMSAGSGGVQAQEVPVKAVVAAPMPRSIGTPLGSTLRRAATVDLDLRRLPQSLPVRRERPDREDPDVTPVELPGLPTVDPESPAVSRLAPVTAPATSANFAGLDFANWGAGHPLDTNGDVGPTHYIQAINSSVGIYVKSTGARVAAFTFDTLMAQGNFGNLCDTDNFGDPVVLYDTFEDRWIVTDFAFQLDGGGNVASPPGAYQCFAVSKTGDPVTGGWYFYSLHVTDGLPDYPKFGVWPDGIYMSANMFGFPAAGGFMGTRVWALDKAQMYAGAPSIQIVEFNPPGDEFTILPANARLQTGTPPAGSPNYFSVVWKYTNAVSIYKFHVDWTSIALSSLTGPFTAIAPSSWASPPNTVPAQGGNNNETLPVRLMVQNQYTNIAGAESVWNAHTVLGGAAGTAAPRYYQTAVTGGVVAAATTQASTFAPDTTVNRYIPSVGVDRAGNMALGYSASSASLFAAIRYAGRLAGDPVNSLSQTEASLVEGSGGQTSYTRWGDYSAMTTDPDGCRFWYTSQYYVTTGTDAQTRIGAFAYPGCVPAGSGALQGTVTAAVGGAPIAGATVALGTRTATTNGSGVYSFATLPSGTYPGATASATAFNPVAASGIVIGSGTTTQNFSLAAAPTSACLVDTTQANFQAGVQANVDLTTTPGSVTLLDADKLDQQNTTLGGFGVTISTTTWGGQTFTPAVTGTLVQADINLFCSGCTGTTPSLTLSVRATSGGLPAGADLATATITGFASGASNFYPAVFASPATLAAGTQYALVIRPTANPSVGNYTLTRSGTQTVGADVYAGGAQISGGTSGTVWSILLRSGVTTDAGFRTYVNTGFVSAGTQTSSLKDSNPAVGVTPRWKSLAWTGSTPAATTLRFQAAASDSPFGPFTFVGPDGTAATYFTSGASLAQFDGKRYLKYQASLATSSAAATPVLTDVTTCYLTAPAPVLATAVSRKVHGSAGTFDLALAAAVHNPTTEPRSAGAGGNHSIVLTFDEAVTIGSASVTEGSATAGAPTFAGNSMTVPLSGVADQQFVTVTYSGVALVAGGDPAAGSVRIGFLKGDVNGSRNVTLSACSW